MPTAVCAFKKPRKRRVQINLTIDPAILGRIRDLMKEMEETSLSNFTEGLYDCVLRDDCEGCSAYDDLPDEEKAKIKGKAGAGKWITDEDTE